jgi:hypothetical protein
MLSFISLKDSGQSDLFVAYATFLVPSVVASLLIMGLKIRLIVRRAGERNAKLAAPRTHKADFRWLAERFILHRDQHRHDELMSANRIALHKSYAYMLLAATEDAPFCVLNTLLLSRALRDRFDLGLLDNQRLCSPQYGTNFTLILLILLTSVAALVYKLMHLVHFPSLWAAQKVLVAEEAQLAERAKRLETIARNITVDERVESVEMVALASAAPADDDDEGAQGAAPADGGSAQPPEHRCTVAACPASVAGSSSTASLPLVSLSVRFTESASGKEGSRASVAACMCRDRARASDHAIMSEPPSAAQRSSERGQRRPASPPRLHGRIARGAMMRLPTRRRNLK